MTISPIKIKDLYSGMKLNSFILLEKQKSIWLCQCECGKQVKVRATDLARNHKKSCGCKNARKTDIYLGLKIGKLIIKQKEQSGKWLCKCECGNNKIARGTDLRRGLVKSCGQCSRARKIVEMKKSFTPKKEILKQVKSLPKYNILIGHQFQHFTVIKKGGRGKHICKCICGNLREIANREIILELRSSCGCQRTLIMKKKMTQKNALLEKFPIGMKVHEWTIIGKGQMRGALLCKCSCGTEKEVRATEIRRKMMQSCGCQKYGEKSIATRKETNLERFGEDNYFKTSEHQVKTKKACQQKYGVDHTSQREEYRFKLRDIMIAHPELYTYQSKGESAILDWIKQYYSSSKTLKILNKNTGYEADIYIEELQLGIEYNGLYFHCEEKREKNYHLQKTKAFETQGIRVIHIWEHEWIKRKEAVKSFLLSAISKNQFKIGARKCNLVWSEDKVDLKEAANFLEKYHIQGKTSGVKYVVKVIHENQLVAVATFGKHHRGSGEWVLSRFCTKMDYTIQGVLSRISKLASQQLQSDIISWADYRLSQGNGYFKAGWEKVKLHRPDYFYWQLGTSWKIIPKQSRQKKIVNTPEEMTELEHARIDNLVRVWDCGKIKFIYRYKQ